MQPRCLPAVLKCTVRTSESPVSCFNLQKIFLIITLSDWCDTAFAFLPSSLTLKLFFLFISFLQKWSPNGVCRLTGDNFSKSYYSVQIKESLLLIFQRLRD